MGNNRLLELISRKLAGEATAAELDEIKRMLSPDPEAAENYELLQRYWDQHENVNQAFIDEAFDKIANSLNSPVAAPVVEIRGAEKHTRKKRLQFAAAAAIVLLAGAILFVKSGNKKDRLTEKQAAFIEKRNPKGVKGSFVLPDGSMVWLNADSKIQFPKTFTGRTRDVYLNGEAFFDVAKNPTLPFIVHLVNGSVSVMGTSFNVKAYENDKIVETSVVTGKVAFIPKYRKKAKKQDTVFLSPDIKARFYSAKEEVTVASTVSDDDRAWITGKLIFKGMTFEDISLQLERNFGKKIVFLSDSARLFRLTGSFQNNSLDEILFYLSKSRGFDYKITNGEVLISI